MKIMDVTALGELLIDFAQKDTNTFEGNPGGAPCNVLAMLNKAGKRQRLSARWATICLAVS